VGRQEIDQMIGIRDVIEEKVAIDLEFLVLVAAAGHGKALALS